MKKTILILTLILCISTIDSQPYLDISRVQYMHSPNTGIFNRDKNSHQLSYINTAINIPLKCKPIHGIVILSPLYEQWRNEMNDKNIPVSYYQNFAMAVTLMDTVSYHKIRLAVSPIVRFKNFSKDGTGSAQWGMAGLAIFHKNETFTYKLGIYFNQDYFGDFFMPLVGFDWWINQKDKLFGVLPGSLAYEHRKNKYLYYGISFKAITNSYRDLNSTYFRVDDNQLGIYTDINILKQTVLNLEFGHSVFRKLSLGEKNIYTYNLNVSDNIYAKISVAYRIRFKD